MKILIATQKPFSIDAVYGIQDILEGCGHEVALLEKYPAQEDLVAAVADVDALIVRSDKVTAEVIAAAPKLKIVVRAGAGYDNVDLAAASAKGIVVMNTPGQNANAVAELAIALMIFMFRGQFTPATSTRSFRPIRSAKPVPNPPPRWRNSIPPATSFPSTSRPRRRPSGPSATTSFRRCPKAVC